MNKIYVVEMSRNPYVDPTYKRYITFDLDDSKIMCYRSRVSYNAFFHSMSDRNKTPNYLYIAKTEKEHQIDIEVWDSMMETYPDLTDIYRTVPVTDVKNIWEFYKLIGYDYKAKKWI